MFGDLIDGKAELLQEYHHMEWKHVDTMMLEPSFELDMVTQRYRSELVYPGSGRHLKAEGNQNLESESLPKEDLEPESYMKRAGSLASQIL